MNVIYLKSYLSTQGTQFGDRGLKDALCRYSSIAAWPTPVSVCSVGQAEGDETIFVLFLKLRSVAGEGAHLARAHKMLSLFLFVLPVI
jgi:hypothetical protein